MHQKLKLIHHGHSGRLRGHEHTSYPLLAILLLFVGVVLMMGTVTAQSPGPYSSSVGISGTMPGPPPTEGAVITNPNNQDRFDQSPIEVSGTCPEGLLVEILKNNIFGGSTICTDEGTFSLEMDLMFGRNELVARVYDSLNQPGPNSEPVVVFYDLLPPQPTSLSPLNFSNDQLVITSDAVYRGIFPDQRFSMPVEILGGTPPFALNVEWGDTNNKVVPRDNNQPFNIGHAYSKPGTYQIRLQATDAEGRVAFLTVVAIVNGQPTEMTAGTDTPETPVNRFLVVWPLYVGSLASVASFWLGERREKHMLAKHGLLRPQI